MFRWWDRLWNVLSVFDALLQSIAVEGEPTFDIEVPEQAKQALLASMYPDRYTPRQRLTTTIYEPPEIPILTKDSPFHAPAPVLSGDTLEGYAAWWYEDGNNPYIDA